jgi:hypothetical protein
VPITDTGREALAKKPAKVNIVFLMDYPGFEAFRATWKPKTGSDVAAAGRPPNAAATRFDGMRRMARPMVAMVPQCQRRSRRLGSRPRLTREPARSE